jgi:hypothetical protein
VLFNGFQHWLPIQKEGGGGRGERWPKHCMHI